MPLKITGRHMNISDETRDYLDKKVNRLRRLVPKIDEMSFTLGKEKLHVDADASFRAGKIAVQAKVRAEHVNEAIDMLVDKIESQINKTKKRISDKSAAAREVAKVDGKTLGTEEVIEEEDIEDSRVAEG